MAQTLSQASEYEQLFGTRHRGAGRPTDANGEILFPSRDRHPLLVRVAQRRAYAVVHEENKERLSQLFEREMAVLKRRGPEVVAEDVGVALTDKN